ncbi:MAG: hypothetical protein P8174_03740 [Gemmatimonadota bacterium]
MRRERRLGAGVPFGAVPCGVLLSGLLLCGCGREAASPPPPPVSGLWARYTPFDWPHDGDPYQSSFFAVYSDAAGDTVKRQVGETADGLWGRLLGLFDMHDSWIPAYPPGATGLEIYVNRAQAENINWAYWGGFIITVRASDVTGPVRDYVVYTVGHELTHELEFLMEGREVLGADVWFKEGIAVLVGCLESTAFQTIRTLGELESWIAGNADLPGRGNPVAIHGDSDYPAGADRHQYYRLFELAMRCLLDARGWGRSIGDVRGVFMDLANRVPFSTSFLERFELSVATFEAEFYDRLRAYLAMVDGDHAAPSTRH